MRRPTSMSRGARGLLSVLGGNSLAQLVAFAALPILARLYGPAETALYTLLLSTGLVVSSVASLRLEFAIPIPEDEMDSRRLFWMATLVPFLVLPIISLVGLGLLTVVPASMLPALGYSDYLLVGVFVLVLTAANAAGQLAIRMRRYGLLGRIPVTQTIATLSAQIGLGLAGFGRGLFVGGVFGRSFGILGLTRGCDVAWRDRPSGQQASELLRRFWRFPLVFTPAALVNTVGLYVPSLMLPVLFGLGPAGLYAIAFRIAIAPSGVFIQSTRQVFLGEFARTITRQEARRTYLKWSALLLALAVVMIAGIWLIVAPALPSLLGPQWAGAEELVKYAGVMAGAALVGSPIQGVWTVRQRGLAQFSWDLLRLIATAGTIWGSAHRGGSLEETVQALALVTCVTYAVSWLGCLWTAARVPAERAPLL